MGSFCKRGRRGWRLGRCGSGVALRCTSLVPGMWVELRKSRNEWRKEVCGTLESAGCRVDPVSSLYAFSRYLPTYSERLRPSVVGLGSVVDDRVSARLAWSLTKITKRRLRPRFCITCKSLCVGQG